MAARFILSLDCEGKWGLADQLEDREARLLTDDRLRVAYRSILDVLDDYDVPATFAFVGLFSQSAASFARVRAEVDALAVRAPAYLKPALRSIDHDGDGWHGDQLVAAVAASPTGHEIALHGVTHVPWTDVDADFVRDELRLGGTLDGPVRDSRTFVYPRNLVAHVDILAEQGMAGFRTARSKRSRAASFISEFDLMATPDVPPRPTGLVPIPAGFFLNWRSGLRRLVPRAVTIARARRLLDSASANGGIVHYWLHPENVATAPATLTLFRALVREVARRRDSGDCHIMTQLGYCCWIELRPGTEAVAG